MLASRAGLDLDPDSSSAEEPDLAEGDKSATGDDAPPTSFHSEVEVNGFKFDMVVYKKTVLLKAEACNLINFVKLVNSLASPTLDGEIGSDAADCRDKSDFACVFYRYDRQCYRVRFMDDEGVVREKSDASLHVPHADHDGRILSVDELNASREGAHTRARLMWNRLDKSDRPRFVMENPIA